MVQSLMISMLDAAQDDRLWTATQAGHCLGRPCRTVRSWRASGRIPFVIDPGGNIRYRSGSIRLLARGDLDLLLDIPQFEPASDDRLLDDRALGLLLGRDARSIRRWRSRGLLPVVTDPGGYWRYHSGTIRRMIRDSEGWMG
jgi:predicted site-specific integrase-resolvase